MPRLSASAMLWVGASALVLGVVGQAFVIAVPTGSTFLAQVWGGGALWIQSLATLLEMFGVAFVVAAFVVRHFDGRE
ncbi:hypothetical protein [Isoptericola sp. NPDC055881]